MIRNNDLLSKYPDAVKVRMVKGYVAPSDSDIGISWDIVGEVSYPLRAWSEIPTRKPRNRFYLEYILTIYKSKMKFDHGGYSEFRHVEYMLPNGTVIYTNDCGAGDSQCRKDETNDVIKLFNQHRYNGMEVIQIRKKKITSKPKRKTCRCKK